MLKLFFLRIVSKKKTITAFEERDIRIKQFKELILNSKNFVEF